MIHSTAIIHPGAQLDSNVEVGPYAVIDEHVVLGPGCVVGPGVYLTGHTVIGANNRFHAGCVIGDAPQDFKYAGLPTRLRIGDNNVFREHVTVHRSNKMEEDTVVGSNNFLMNQSHVGHNAILGDHVVLASGALLAGHVTVGNRAFISGNCLVHQFVRIGTLVIMQGGAKVSVDVPPFMVAAETNEICGLNTIGLRRAGFTSEQRLELRKLYHALFLSGKKLTQSLAAARNTFTSPNARLVMDFIAAAKRGVCRHRSSNLAVFKDAEPE